MTYGIIDGLDPKLVSYNINNYVIGNVVVGVNSRVTIGEHVSVVVIPWTVFKFQCYLSIFVSIDVKSKPSVSSNSHARISVNVIVNV